MNKPIIDPSTLTEEQREELRKKYQYYDDRIDYDPLDPYSGPYNRIYEGKIGLLIELFGSNFFKKGE